MKIRLDSPEVTEFFDKLTAKGNVVFVTGCARSGTSLLHRCLSTLESPDYLWSENSLLNLYDRGAEPGGNIILKRTAKCHKTALHRLPKGVKVVHIVRHPADVLTSRVRQRKGYYVTPERWIAETEAYWRMKDKHPGDRLHVVRYEDLIADPNGVQRQIGEALSLRFDHPFTEYLIRNHLDRKIDEFTQELRVWEAIDVQRTEKNRSEEEKRERMAVLRADLQPYIGKFCNEFGYAV